MSYNVLTTARTPQILIDQAALQQIQAELQRRIADLERLRIAIETLSQVNEPDRFAAAAMALCNQLASRWKAERASIGFLKGRYVRLAALSHTEKFTRQMQLVQDIEAAMEECLDQDVEILFPPAPNATYVARAADRLSSRHGPSALCCLPLRRGGEVLAVLAIERKADVPFGLEEVETLRLTADLATARLVNLYEHDRWFGAKLLAGLRKFFAFVLGSRHTWAKLIALAVAGFVAFAVLVQGDFRVESPSTFQASEQQIVPAPFDGRLRTVRVGVGDVVFSRETAETFQKLGRGFYPLPNPYAFVDSTLATLDTAELQNKLALARADSFSYLKQADKARGEGKTSEAQVNEALAAKADAQIADLERQIREAVLHAPIDGVVFAGDLKPNLNATVKIGDPLFEIGQPQFLRAELSVPEEDVTYLQLGQPGQLATASYPGHKIGFTVERINPKAEVSNQHNVFKVRVRFDKGAIEPWMRPGMEGLAKVDVGRKSYAWLWSHRLINWVRMKLWL